MRRLFVWLFVVFVARRCKGGRVILSFYRRKIKQKWINFSRVYLIDRWKFRCSECQAQIDLPEGNCFKSLPTSFFHNSLLSLFAVRWTSDGSNITCYQFISLFEICDLLKEVKCSLLESLLTKLHLYSEKTEWLVCSVKLSKIKTAIK